MSHYVVGLTGGIGSGKSTVAECFGQRGITVVDTDAIAHELTAPGGEAMPAIMAAFGETYVTAAGALDRPRMRQLVFTDDTAKARLEAILHPRIRALAEQRCRAAGSPHVLLAVPLLIESGDYRQRCDRILVVDSPESIQVARVMQRSGLGQHEVEAIIARQASRQARLAAADDILDNQGGLAELDRHVAILHARYLAEAGKKPQANC